MIKPNTLHFSHKYLILLFAFGFLTCISGCYLGDSCRGIKDEVGISDCERSLIPYAIGDILVFADSVNGDTFRYEFTDMETSWRSGVDEPNADAPCPITFALGTLIFAPLSPGSPEFGIKLRWEDYQNFRSDIEVNFEGRFLISYSFDKYRPNQCGISPTFQEVDTLSLNGHVWHDVFMDRGLDANACCHAYYHPDKGVLGFRFADNVWTQVE